MAIPKSGVNKGGNQYDQLSRGVQIVVRKARHT